MEGGFLIMKGKAVLKALLFAYGVTGMLLLFLAFLLFQFNLGEGTAAGGIVAVYVLACFFGGFAAGKFIRKDKYFWGTITGLTYFLLLVLVSFGVQGKWDMTVQHVITTFFMCLGGGALGGMLS